VFFGTHQRKLFKRRENLPFGAIVAAALVIGVYHFARV
jgi:hypothetical protein